MKKIYLSGLALLAQTSIVLAQNGDNSQAEDPNGTLDFWVGFLFIIFVIVLVIWLVRRSNSRRNLYYKNNGMPYNNPFETPPLQNSGPGAGDFLAGAIIGAAAAEIIEDMADSGNYNQLQGDFSDSSSDTDSSGYNQDDNDNSWDSGSSDSSFSDDSFNDDSNF